MQRFKCVISYHGKFFFGWQKQNEATKTVQSTIENILNLLDNRITQTHCAGRTDTGVHALGQVFHVDMERSISSHKLLLALNAHLVHENISILRCDCVDNIFHARFSAKKRKYRYRILNRRAIPCLEKDFVWHIGRELSLQAMQEASRYIIGKHDLSSFRSSTCQALTPIKTIDLCDIYKREEEIIIDIEAPSFMHHQVRNIVGTLVEIGKGRWNVEKMQEIIEAKDRTKAGPTAPAQGLCFMEVSYDVLSST